jgi:hypothetical protein
VKTPEELKQQFKNKIPDLEALGEVSEIVGKPFIFLDFEYNSSNEPMLNLVCCSTLDHNGEVREFWLHRNQQESELVGYLEQWDDVVLFAYAATAEARSMLALYLDPHEYNWIDIYAEHRQLTYNNNECEYGAYPKHGRIHYSTPKHFVKALNKGKDNTAVGMGMADCVALHLEICIDTTHKTKMRDLIISAPEHFGPNDKIQITDYCTSDVMPLPNVFIKQWHMLLRLTKMSKEELLRAMYKRGRFMASGAKMEQEGCPLNRQAAWNLRLNFAHVRETIIQTLVDESYPFFVKDRPKGKNLQGEWVNKYDAFVTFIQSLGDDVYDKWPRTINKDTKLPTDKLSRAEKTLDKYEGIPEIAAYKQATKSINQLRWFKEPDEGKADFFDSVGSDDRVRTFLGLYGTQTSRNAPKASRFILAMSSWLRCLIVPKKGETIIAIDYASQEFAIAAVLANDPNMVAAYRSGDPYLYFAKKAGAVPEEADPSIVKGDKPVPEGMEEMYEEAKRQRGLFKSTTLGLQYGMGFENLAIKLTADMGEVITPMEAKRLINLHKMTYPRYWQWLDELWLKYKTEKVLTLWDGWAILGDNDNALSVKNTPTQGTGAVIMREAVDLCHAKAIRLIAPLHDALYGVAKDEDVSEVRGIMADCMLEAVRTVIGAELDIRLDIDIHDHDHTWVEGKGHKYYHQLKQYLEPMPSKDEELQTLLETIFS